MHRRPFTTQDAYSRGVTHAALKHGLSQGRIQRVLRGIYIEGADPVTPVETALAALVATSGVASGALAGVLHGLDSVRLQGKLVTIPTERDSRLAAVQRADLEPQQTVTIDGYRCTNGAQTMIGLAVILNDLQWEQALESALHKRLLRVEDLGAVSDFRGSKRIRRVLALRPPGVPPTESLLETLMVQLIRTESLLPAPQRQVIVLNKWDRFVARVDLAWPEHGIFLELDGQHHKDQPVYDANRQTAVVAARGWMPGRFTWHEVTRAPTSTLWRLRELFEQAFTLRRTA